MTDIPATHPGDGRLSGPLRIKMYCPIHLRVEWQGHIVFGIAQCFFDHGVDLEVWAHSADAPARKSYVREGVPGLLNKVLYRLHKVSLIDRVTMRRFWAH